ncbi:protein ECT2 [Etheostoma spectabile]|uniref:protein ECT2 n=1 Tax=Etheostoma spectabile TaxID=54343 RepID=UPI0013AF3110|nr:protein ECT2-like [Etheostoma spectabile]
METSLSDHSGRITQVEHDVGKLQSNLKSVVQENAALKAKVEDLESRSKRQNLRVLGLPENIEGKDPRDFVAKMFSSLLGEILSAPPELDRAHRSLQPKPRPGDPPRPFIERFHRYIEREIVLNWAKTHRDISYNSIRIRIFEDFSVAVAKKRSAFNGIKGLLYKRGVKFGMLYPARLRVTYGNRERIFDFAEDAETFFQERILSSEKCTAELFKLPLEKEGQVGGPILAQEELKTIFCSIPEIYEVHTRIKSDLEELLTDWSEDKSVGDIILKYSKELVKAYPPFVNFFEMSKETIVSCEKQKPRFHAFLKINEAKPECGRQTLVELLIRPVQRLPSVALLLNDIKKHTPDDNPDKITLEKAIESLKEVMTHINEDKRKTEGQKQIFDVVYEVDGCPANLLSSHRTLVYRVETIALGDQPCDRGEHVTLFLFNDCLEIARKRHKVINTFKSPLGQTRPPPPLKHITLMPLSQIRRVLDLQDTEDCVNAFALVVRPPTEQENLLFSFQLAGEEMVKSVLLRTLCRHVANTICRADAEDLIQCTDPNSLQVNTKDMDSTLSKASRAIKKTSKKVTRAFSFTKTPKRVIQRAFMANSTPDEKSQRLSCENRIGSSSTLAISRSTSTFSLSDSAKSSAVVQRSNSLDHPPVRARVPVCIRTPCSPAQNPAHIPGPEFSQSLCPDYCPSTQEPKSILPAPLVSQSAQAHSGLYNSQQSTSSTLPTSIPAIQNSAQLNPKTSHPTSSQHVSRHLPSVGFQPRLLVPQLVNVKGMTFSESCRDPQDPLEPHKAALNSPRRETLL